jgi:hypothetical protein
MDNPAITTQHQRRLQALLLDQVSDGVSLFDLKSGLISYTNAADDRLFRCPPGGAAGRHFTARTAYADQERERIGDEVMRALREEGEWSGEWLNRRDDGSHCQTRARITTPDVDGCRYGVCLQEDGTRWRLEALDDLLPTLSDVLDIRSVFERVSQVAGTVVPHDDKALVVLTDDKRSIYTYALTAGVSHFPELVPVPEHRRERITAPRDHVLDDDIQLDDRDRDSPPVRRASGPG